MTSSIVKEFLKNVYTILQQNDSADAFRAFLKSNNCRHLLINILVSGIKGLSNTSELFQIIAYIIKFSLDQPEQRNKENNDHDCDYSSIENCFSIKPKQKSKQTSSISSSLSDEGCIAQGFYVYQNITVSDYDQFQLFNDLLINLCIEECSSSCDECLSLRILTEFCKYLKEMGMIENKNILLTFFRSLLKMSRIILIHHAAIKTDVFVNFKNILSTFSLLSVIRNETILAAILILRTMVEFSNVSSTPIIVEIIDFVSKTFLLSKFNFDKHIFDKLCILIYLVKKRKVDFCHISRCLRNRHNICKKIFNVHIHHHHDVLCSENLCFIKTFSNILLKHIKTSNHTLALKSIRKCGLCCCISLADLFSLLRLKQNEEMFDWFFDVLLYELGCYDMDYSFCTLCSSFNTHKWNELSQLYDVIMNCNCSQIFRKLEEFISLANKTVLMVLLDTVYIKLFKTDYEENLHFEVIINHLLNVFESFSKNVYLCDIFIEKVGFDIFQQIITKPYYYKKMFNCFDSIIIIRKQNIELQSWTIILEICQSKIVTSNLDAENYFLVWNCIHVLIYYSEDARNYFVKGDGAIIALEFSKYSLLEAIQFPNIIYHLKNFFMAFACAVISFCGHPVQDKALAEMNDFLCNLPKGFDRKNFFVNLLEVIRLEVTIVNDNDKISNYFQSLPILDDIDLDCKTSNTADYEDDDTLSNFHEYSNQSSQVDFIHYEFIPLCLNLWKDDTEYQIYALKKIVLLLQQFITVKEYFYKNAFHVLILEKYLENNNNDVRQLLLDIYFQVIENNISSPLLSDFMRIAFHETTLNIDIFLNILLNCSNFSICPSFYLEFPIEYSLPYKNMQRLPDLTYYERCTKHIESFDVCKISPVQLLLKEEIICPVKFCNEWSISIWLAFYSSNSNIEQYHILSIGNKSLTVQIWWDVYKSKLVIKMFYCGDNKKILISETYLKLKLNIDGMWNNYTFSYNENISEQVYEYTFTVFVNGRYGETFSSSYDFSKNLNNLLSIIILGDTIVNKNENIVTYYNIGTMMLFKNLILSKDKSILIYILGPNVDNLCECDNLQSNIAFKHSDLIHHVIESGLDVDGIFERISENLDILRKNVTVIFNARRFEVFGLLNTKDIGINPVESNIKKSLQQNPSEVPTTLLTDITFVRSSSFEQSLYYAGGAALLLYLFAKTVRFTTDSITQARSLNLLLKVVKRSRLIAQEFDAISSYDLLLTVFSSDLFVMSTDCLKILLEATYSSLIFSIENNEILLKSDNTNLYVINGRIITDIFLSWKLWIRYEDLWIYALRSVVLLLEESNEAKIYNIKTLSELQFLEKIKHMCLEYKEINSIKNSKHFFSVEICEVLNSIIEKILLTKLDIHSIVTITDLIMLLYPSSLIYVQYSDTGYYFNPNWLRKKATRKIDNFELYSKTLNNNENPDKKSHASTPTDSSDEWELLQNKNINEPVLVNIKKISTDIDLSQEDNFSLIHLTCGLLKILNKTLLKMTKNDVEKVFKVIFKIDFLIVLLHHSAESIRIATLRLLETYLNLANDKQLSILQQRYSFQLIAFQLHQNQAVKEILDILLSIFFQKFISTELVVTDLYKLEHFSIETKSVTICSLIPFIALLENCCLNNSKLCIDLLILLCNILNANLVFYELLRNNYICTVLCNVIFQIIPLPDIDKMAILSAIGKIFKILILMDFRTGDSKSLIFLKELIVLLKSLKRKIQMTNSCELLPNLIENIICDCLLDVCEYSLEIFFKLEKPIKSEMLEIDNFSQRLTTICTFITEYIICWDDIGIPLNEIYLQKQKSFTKYFLQFLLRISSYCFKKSSFFDLRIQLKYLQENKDIIFNQLSILIGHIFDAHSDKHMGLHSIQLLANYSNSEILLQSICSLQFLGQKMMSFITKINTLELTEATKEEVAEISAWLKRNFYFFKTPLQEKNSHDLYNRKKDSFQQYFESAVNNYLKTIEDYSKILYDEATDIIHKIVKQQNTLRKDLINSMKISSSAQILARRKWKHIVDDMSHERAPCFAKHEYPQSWKLDETEGPMRVRKRLKRCYLTMDKKFFISDKKCCFNSIQTLSYLFKTKTSDQDALIYQLQTSEKITIIETCSHVSPARELDGEILVGEKCLYFIGDNVESIILPFEDIKSILKRRHALRDIAVEIFLVDGTTCFLALKSTSCRDKLIDCLNNIELPNLIEMENVEVIQQMWIEREILNFDYLVQLNTFAGRSYNDLMQYFVFPFILSNYNEKFLHLKDAKNYRILSKPISVQNKVFEKRYLDNYTYLEKQNEEFNSDNDSYRTKPYHYGSHYSNSGTVLHFLVRLPPFTEMFLEYQDKNFDLPDRSFHSMATTWRLSSSESTTDFKELIPEFFSLPEFLVNNENFNFGVKQNGIVVSDVQLPDWCENNSRYFTLIMRQALESSIVTSTIASWIDLVFGFKQTGKAAVEAINVFHPMTYYGVDFEQVSDEMHRTAIKTMIKTYGQTPKQLFTIPHPNPKINQQESVCTLGEAPSILPTVSGLKWGKYVGSPEYGPPIEVWRKQHSTTVEHLLALTTGEVFGLGKNSSMLVMYSREYMHSLINGLKPNTSKQNDNVWAALVFWNNIDSVIRVRSKRKAPLINLVQWQLIGCMPTCCETVNRCRLLLFGTDVGLMCAFKTKYSYHKTSNIQIHGEGKLIKLYGHSSRVNQIVSCSEFSIFASCSDDRTIIIWDMNKLLYIRSIVDHHDPIHILSISKTLGDISSASYLRDGRCQLHIHTINGRHVGSAIFDERITAMAYSTAPEGRSINCLACGFDSGKIRLYCSWTVKFIQEFNVDSNMIMRSAVRAIIFSADSQLLYISCANGCVVVFENSNNRNTSRQIKFKALL